MCFVVPNLFPSNIVTQKKFSNLVIFRCRSSKLWMVSPTQLCWRYHSLPLSQRFDLQFNHQRRILDARTADWPHKPHRACSVCMLRPGCFTPVLMYPEPIHTIKLVHDTYDVADIALSKCLTLSLAVDIAMIQVNSKDPGGGTLDTQMMPFDSVDGNWSTRYPYPCCKWTRFTLAMPTRWHRMSILSQRSCRPRNIP